jgi:flavodoxin
MTTNILVVLGYEKGNHILLLTHHGNTRKIAEAVKEHCGVEHVMLFNCLKTKMRMEKRYYKRFVY